MARSLLWLFEWILHPGIREFGRLATTAVRGCRLKQTIQGSFHIVPCEFKSGHLKVKSSQQMMDSESSEMKLQAIVGWGGLMAAC